MEKIEDTDTGNSEEIKARKESKKSIVVFIILPVIMTILIPLGVLPYIYGRMSWHMGLVIMLYPVVGIFIVYCFFAGIRRLFGGWRKYNNKKNYSLLQKLLFQSYLLYYS